MILRQEFACAISAVQPSEFAKVTRGSEEADLFVGLKRLSRINHVARRTLDSRDARDDFKRALAQAGTTLQRNEMYVYMRISLSA